MQPLENDPRFGDRHEITRVNFLDSIHPLEREHDAAADWNAAAHVAVTGATRRHRNAMGGGKAEYLLDFPGPARQRDGVGQMRCEPFVTGVLA